MVVQAAAMVAAEAVIIPRVEAIALAAAAVEDTVVVAIDKNR